MVLSNAIICMCCLSCRDCGPLLSLKVLLGACRSAQKSIFAERKICFVDLCFKCAKFYYDVILFFVCFYFIFLSLHKSWNQKICFVTLMYPSHIYD